MQTIRTTTHRYSIKNQIYRVGQKNQTIFRLDNFVTVSPRKACSMSKFSQFYREKRYKTRISVNLNILCQIATTAEIMVYMTRTHGFYSIYTNIQWNNCHFPTELVQMFQLVNVWNFVTIHHLLQCSPICFSRTECRHIVHATLLLTCAQMCQSSLNRKTGRQTALILIWLIRPMQFGGIAADGVSSQNFTHWPAETCAYWLLGSDKAGHIESSDRSAAKRLLMVIKAKGAHAEFRLD